MSNETRPTGGLLESGLEGLSHNFLTGTLEELVKWARRHSVMPATFGLACCAIEMMAAGGPHYDLSRYGMETFRASPRQADLIIVAGRVSQKMAPVLRQIYDQMLEPKWVISMGVCASSGGMFNNYAIVQGVDQIVPVDVYAPGCPPSPETLMHAILTLHDKIKNGELTRRKGEGAGLVIEELGASGTRPRDAGSGLIMTDVDAQSGEVDTPTEIAPEMLHNTLLTCSHGQLVLHPTRDAYASLLATLHSDGYHSVIDLCGVDYLTNDARVVPASIELERFEVVVNLINHRERSRLRLRVQVPEDDPTLPSAFTLYPGTEAMERETFDMFGITFDGHPDLTRILMPEDWIGHPLRKDYDPGRIPVQFKGAPANR